MTEQITRELVAIDEKPRQWGNDPAKSPAFEVGFQLKTAEGQFEFGEYRSTEDGWAKVIERASESIGKTVTFDAEPKKEYQGVKQWKLKSYPGKPEGKGDFSGGGGQKKGDWETSAERADRRLNDAAGKVLGVAAVMVGDQGTPADRAAALADITPKVREAFQAARTALKADFPTLKAPEPTAAPQVNNQPQAADWGPAKEEPKPELSPADQADLDRAWTELIGLVGSKAKALNAANRHHNRKANADAYSYGEVMEVLVALA